MMFTLKKSILLSILLLLFSACTPKANGKYHTKYSYHPYYSLYAKKMSKTAPEKQTITFKSKKQKTKISSNNKVRFPNNSSKK